MDKEFIVSIIAIIVPCITAIISIAISIESNNRSKESNNRSKEIEKINSDLMSGQIELQIREMIFSAQKNFTDIGKQLVPDKDDNFNAKMLDMSLEMVCNAYDEACAKYLDGKVDKVRFKKIYYTEIKNLVEKEDTKPYYDTIDSKFQATIKVYKEWNNLEK